MRNYNQISSDFARALNVALENNNLGLVGVRITVICPTCMTVFSVNNRQGYIDPKRFECAHCAREKMLAEKEANHG